MTASIVDRFRNEREVGVPRRFSVGGAFVLVTIYGALFRLLLLLGADATWTGLICLFFGVVTIAQMTLFRGVRPRAASVIAGGITAPALFALVILDEMFTQRLGFKPIEHGFGTLGSPVPAFLLLCAAGVGAGYFVGVALAGVFYLQQKIRPGVRPPTKPSHEGQDSPLYQRIVAVYSFAGRAINPAPKGTPLRGAIAVLEIHLLLAFLFAPFVSLGTPRHVWWYLTAQGLLFAFWIGALQLRFFWPLVLAAIGYLIAPWIFDEVKEIPMFHNVMQARDRVHPDASYHFLHFACTAACVSAGLSLAALVGWLQWLVVRKETANRFGFATLSVACLLLIGLGLLAKVWVRAFAETPRQQLIAKVVAGGGQFGMDRQQKFSYLQLAEGLTDHDAALLLSDLVYGAVLGLRSEEFTDETIAALDGKSVTSLHLSNVTNISDDAFAQLGKGFSAQRMAFDSCRVSSPLLAGMLQDPKMRGMLESLDFFNRAPADLDLSPLANCVSLQSLSFTNVDLSDWDATRVRPLKSLTRILLIACSLKDENVEQICQVLPGSVTELNLKSNDISDAGLVELSRLGQLAQLNVESNARITAAGVAEFLKSNPTCVLRWSEPSP